MDYKKFRKAKAIESHNKKRILKVCPDIPETSGIYFLTRVDEDGFKFAYIGQAKHLLTRLAQHCVGYQHIDLSIKSHGFITEKEYGWKIGFMEYPESMLNEREQYYIKAYALNGYQLRNHTSGGQNSGKRDIAEEPRKGYQQGLKNGYENGLKDLTHFLSTHCTVHLKNPNNKVSRGQAEKWKDRIDIENLD